MKKGILYITLSASLLMGCTDKFTDINTNPYGISDEQLSADYKLVGEQFKQVLQNIYTINPVWVIQLQQNLIGDIYSGYMMSPNPFRGNSNNITYDLVDGWNNQPWDRAYQNVMSPLKQVDIKAGDGFEEFKAWAKICRVEAMHRVSDLYGPIIYSHFGEFTESGGIAYDSQEEAYKQFFADLQSAVDVLTPLAKTAETRPFTSFDLVYGGDYTKWVQFANSLRLRLAMRISKVDPALAQQQAEAAVNHELGVITTNDGNFLVKSDAGLAHPLNTIDNSWNDIRMGASMESILMGYNDPRASAYFEPSEIVPGQIKGIRQGIPIAAKSDYTGFSHLVDLGAIQLMCAAEIYFLRAEGALRGWNMGGSAKELYEQGVTTSFEQYGLSEVAAYLNDAASTPMAYVDPVNAENNIASASSASIKWDDAASKETKLEKIITQKWIAMYPDGAEAWTEFRRTGYPKLFPVRVNNSGGKISTEDFVRRINFISSEYSTNKTEVDKAAAFLKGPDNGGTRLWWDVDAGNF